MNWFFIALTAHTLFTFSYLLDKFILSNSPDGSSLSPAGFGPIRNPAAYAFLPGVLGIIAAALIPFGFHNLAAYQFIYAALAGGLYTAAMVFFFYAIRYGEISRIVPLIGALVPVQTFIFGFFLLGEKIQGDELFGFIFLVLGGVIISAGYRHNLNLKLVGFAVLASFLFGASFILRKIVFGEAGFISGFIWVQIFGFLASLCLLFSSSVRTSLWENRHSVSRSTSYLFFTSRGFSALAFLLQNYAIALGSVVLVNALQPVQYVFLIILGGILALRWPGIFVESFGRKIILAKIAAIFFILIGLLILNSGEPAKLEFGLTYSEKFAEDLGLDVRGAYLHILDELHIKKIRLIGYWDIIEPKSGEFDFKDLDWQISEAEKRDVDVILALGYKTPRWPECHAPSWVKKLPLISKKEYILRMLKETVLQYKDSKTIKVWQIENEPAFPFGECDGLGLDFLYREIDLVRSLDSRPIMLTDSGEFGFAWPILGVKADIFGTTLYRYVYNQYLGYTRYWFIPESYFRLKAFLIGSLYHKELAIAELQAEPWGATSLINMSSEDQAKTMNPEIFKEIIDYAARSGFPSAYLWGAEWWYWLKEKRGDTRMWDEAKALMAP